MSPAEESYTYAFSMYSFEEPRSLRRSSTVTLYVTPGQTATVAVAEGRECASSPEEKTMAVVTCASHGELGGEGDSGGVGGGDGVTASLRAQ